MEYLNKELLSAVERRNEYEVLECLKKGADINYKGDDGKTALHVASGEGHERIVNILLKGEADVNAQDINDWTPLHEATRQGHYSIVKLLLEGGAYCNAKDDWGYTPLHWAVQWQNNNIVTILTEGGADINAKDKAGDTPLDYAEEPLKKTMMDIYFQKLETEGFNFPKMDDINEFGELMSKGTYASFNNIVYLGGACNVGKTTLASILIGEQIPDFWDSTDGLNIFFGRFGIDLNTKKMVAISEDSGNRDILSTVIIGRPSMKPPESQEDPNRPTSGTRISPVSDKLRGRNRKLNLKSADKAESKNTKTAVFLIKGGVPELMPETRPILRNPKLKALPAKSFAGIHNDIKEKLKKGTYKVRIALSDLVDFGGQRSFDMTHQLFIRQKGVFVLMIDGSKNLYEELKEYPQGDITTASILLHWVNSILTYCGVDDDDILPLIIFAATHRDSFRREVDVEARKRELIHDTTKLFCKHENRQRILYDSLYFINGKDKSDSGIQTLKAKLVEVAFQQKSWGQKMPMAWVPLELQISEMRTNGINLISTEELSKLNTANGELALSNKQLNHFLKTQHFLGRIMYFDLPGLQSFTIIQPRALVDILRSVITDERFWPEDPVLNKILRDITHVGLISKRDLFRLWSQEQFNPLLPTAEIKEFIAQVLVQLDILVPPKRYKELAACTNDFLVPCIVNRKVKHMRPGDAVMEDKTICLSYKLVKSDLPSAISYKIIGALLNIWPIKENHQGVCLFHKAAILSIDATNDLYVFMTENQIMIHLTNSDSKFKISPDIASIVQECVSLTLEKVLEFYHASFGKLGTFNNLDLFKIEVGEICHGNICLIPLSEAQKVDEWECKQKKHKTKTCLYWIHKKAQKDCSVDCKGIDAACLEMVPDDKHLLRLAEQIGGKFYEFIIHLGLTKVQWEDIEASKRDADRLTQKFLGLCKWKKNKQARNMSPTFLDLSKALTGIEYSQHFLCKVFREEYTEAFDLEYPRLLKIPDDGILWELSEKHIGPLTLPLGIELGLDMNSIDETIVRYPKDMFSQTYDILKKWKKSTNVQPTVRTLMLALQHVDGRAFKFLQQSYDAQQTTHI